jgi:hypothetical protein
MNKMEQLVLNILHDEQTLDAPKLANLLFTRTGKRSGTLFDAYLKVANHLLTKLHDEGRIELQRDGWYAPLTYPSGMDPIEALMTEDELQINPAKPS